MLDGPIPPWFLPLASRFDQARACLVSDTYLNPSVLADVVSAQATHQFPMRNTIPVRNCTPFEASIEWTSGIQLCE